MSRLIIVPAVSLLALASCSTTELPPTDPPPPWGVPISGGTMLVTRDGAHAVISDPDRDHLTSVELATGKVTSDLALSPGDEPGRLVEDQAGRIHVALRRGGAVVTLTDGTNSQIAFRRPVCAEPRGITFDGATDQIHVACAGGELVTFAAGGGDATRVLRLDRDLRDVIVSGSNLIVTRFRSAEVLTLDAQGAVTNRVVPPTVKRLDLKTGPLGGLFTGDQVDAIPAVAWRTIALADGRLVMAHQRQLKGMLQTTPGGYSGGCGQGPVEDAISVGAPGEIPAAAAPAVSGSLPVDVAVSPSGGDLAFALAGSKMVRVVSTGVLNSRDDDMCGGGDAAAPSVPINDQLGAPTSVAYAPNGDLVVFYPELPAIVIHAGTTARTITLPGELGYDSGRALFHAQTQSGLACASCHPEGRDDGLIWTFDGLGTRRTQSLAGHILQRAPYHWSGDQADLPTLMQDVFGQRMGGGAVSHSQEISLGPWLDRVPAAISPPGDPIAIARGKAVFETPSVGCVGCHGGPVMSNHLLVDVGTGAKFKVPSLLGVGARAPYLHDGCAATLRDRFGACGGGELHGKTAQLGADQLSDLIAYLDSL